MQFISTRVVIVALLLLTSACATTQTNGLQDWLNNAQKIDEENNHK
jgi:Tfp pilus assembly protein PilP